MKIDLAKLLWSEQRPARAFSRRRCANASASRCARFLSPCRNGNIVRRGARVLGVASPTGRQRDRQTGARYAARRRTPAAPGPRFRRGRRRQGGITPLSPTGAAGLDVDAIGLDTMDRRYLPSSPRASAAARSGSRRWRRPSPSRVTRSRTSSNPI